MVDNTQHVSAVSGRAGGGDEDELRGDEDELRGLYRMYLLLLLLYPP